MATNTTVAAGSVVYLALHLIDAGVPVELQSPTVELRRLSDGKYFDWSAASAPYWKTSGGQSLKVLPEKSWKPGLYQVPWNHSLYDDGSPGVYTAIYRNDGVGYVGEEVEYLTFEVDVAIDVSFIRKLLSNKSILDLLTESTATHTWFDDDGTTEILKHDITIVGSQEIREPE